VCGCVWFSLRNNNNDNDVVVVVVVVVVLQWGNTKTPFRVAFIIFGIFRVSWMVCDGRLTNEALLVRVRVRKTK
jgi:hypothetical protein